MQHRKKNKVKSLKLKGSVTEEHKRTGSWEIYGWDKTLRGQFEFKQGVATGRYKLFHSNGRIKESGQFQSGLKNGEIKTYNLNGKEISSQQYQMGKLDGSTIFKYGSGKTHTVCFYQNDSLQGEYQRFYEDGKIKVKGGFKDGYAFGEWTFNIRLNEVCCTFLIDEKGYSLLDGYFEENAMDDCTASFDMLFEHKINKDCYRGVCVIPRFTSPIR
mgnify:FL=1